MNTQKLEQVPIDKLVPYARNARTHSKEQIAQLRASLREFGFVSPAVIDADYNILVGHGRITAAREEGYETVPCVFAENLTEAQKRAYILADNQLALNAGWDEEMLSVVREYKDYSELGHMDLIARYDEKGVYPFEKIKPIVEEILQVVIADGKGLEVNTSSYRYGLSDTTPSVEILKRYRELGGKIVTIGSDSHKPEHLGAYIEETKEMLRKAGYTQFCTYERMSPVFHDL